MIRPPLPPEANPDAALLSYCEQAEARVLELTEQLVNMDSGTDDLPELERKAHFLADIFRGLGADSVDLVELVMAMEEEFELDEIPEEELTSLKTVGDCVRYLSTKLG